MAPLISAYVPCYNNAQTIEQAIRSIQAQTVPVAELFVIDDGSDDDSIRRVEALGVPVVSMGTNSGRGAVRARAMDAAKHELVLGCDATNALDPGFLEKALPWFIEPTVAAVFGRIGQGPPRNAIERWRGRHLFKLDLPLAVGHHAPLITFGVLARCSTLLAVGNYNPRLRHSEDDELGKRLLAAGYDVVFDPELRLISVADNSLWQVLDRYRRWYAGKDDKKCWHAYLKNIAYSLKVMAIQDLKARDPLSVPISLLCPHYQFWRSPS